MSLTDHLLLGFVRECVIPPSACSPLCQISSLIWVYSWTDAFHHKIRSGIGVGAVSSDKDLLLLPVVLFAGATVGIPGKAESAALQRARAGLSKQYQ